MDMTLVLVHKLIMSDKWTVPKIMSSGANRTKHHEAPPNGLLGGKEMGGGLSRFGALPFCNRRAYTGGGGRRSPSQHTQSQSERTQSNEGHQTCSGEIFTAPNTDSTVTSSSLAISGIGYVQVGGP